MATSKKQNREKALALKFLHLHTKSEPLILEYLRLGDPSKKEPDIICSDNYSIEIVSVYDNDSQSKNYWEDMKGIRNHNQQREILLQPDYELVDTIKNKLNKLEEGLYSGVNQSRILLLCYHESPLFNYREAIRLKEGYQPFKPDNHFKNYFFEIWIMWREGGDSYGILKLE